jgi:hypothetical protein
MIATSDVLATISSNRWTALILAADGQIAEVVPFPGELTSDDFLEFTRTHARGRRFRLVQQSDLSEVQLNTMLSEVTATSADAAPGSATLSERVEAFEPGLHPLAPARAIAEAIARWFCR